MVTKTREVVKVLHTHTHTHTHTCKYYIHLERKNNIDKHTNLAKGGDFFS